VIRQNIRLGGKVAHLLQTRGRGGLKKGLRVRYTLQNHIPSDLLPPTRPYLLFPPSPNNAIKCESSNGLIHRLGQRLQHMSFGGYFIVKPQQFPNTSVPNMSSLGMLDGPLDEVREMPAAHL
jgi:hypothetical protein